MNHLTLWQNLLPQKNILVSILIILYVENPDMSQQIKHYSQFFAIWFKGIYFSPLIF